MIKWLILLGLVIGLGDPILLYCIYSAYGFTTALLVAILPAIIGPRLIVFCRKPPGSPENPIGVFGDDLLFFAANMLFRFPGPISTVCALLLLIPAVRRMIQAIALRALTNAMQSGNVSMMSSIGGMSVSSGFGQTGPFGAEPSMGDLKPAEGRVVDTDSPRLDNPKTDLP